MLGSIISGLTSASLSVLSAVLTKKMFEVIIRKLLAAIIKAIVASTENTVDDDIVKPVLDKLKE